MGCFGSKARSQSEHLDASEGDSSKCEWNNPSKVDLSELTIENERSSQVIKKPGCVNGQQFVVQNCEKATLCIMDYLDSATVDDCQDCTIFIGPTKRSVFIRNCSNCRIISASQQFRARDCKNLYLYLYCLTKPTIESCENIQLACYSFYYPSLSDQFKKAGLTVFNNSWSHVYDFSSQDGEKTWSCMDPNLEPQQVLSDILQLKDTEISLEKSMSVVPQTMGNPPDEQVSTTLIIFFPDGNREKRAKAFIREMLRMKCPLIATKEFVMKEVEAEQVFRSDSYNSVVNRGPVIALHHYGQDCIRKSQEAAKTIALETGSTGLVYVSNTQDLALQQIQLIFNDGPQRRFCAKNSIFQPRLSNAGQIS